MFNKVGVWFFWTVGACVAVVVVLTVIGWELYIEKAHPKILKTLRRFYD